jgi:hypothetical protein
MPMFLSCGSARSRPAASRLWTSFDLLLFFPLLKTTPR